LQGFLIHAGYPAVIVLAFLEACCIPVSSEVIFGFAGVLAYQGHLNLVLVIVAGTLAELAGSYVSYLAGRLAERPVIERLGRFLLITRADVVRAELFLAGHGGWAIPAGRALPLVRSFTSLAAGFAGVPPLRFGALSLIGTVLYVGAVSSVGYALGPAWNRVNGDLTVAGYVAAGLVAAALAVFVIRRLREVRREAVTPVRSPEESQSSGGTDRGDSPPSALT
jgi:membrane protein DedA with SNARE-associated domain